MKKQVTFQTFKHLRNMTLRDFNKWLIGVIEASVQTGYDEASKDVILEIGEQELFERIMSVSGIGEKRAKKIMEAIVGDDTNIS